MDAEERARPHPPGSNPPSTRPIKHLFDPLIVLAFLLTSISLNINANLVVVSATESPQHLVVLVETRGKGLKPPLAAPSPGAP